MKRGKLLVWLLGVALLCPLAAVAASGPEDIKNLIVMIQSKLPQGEEVGAGIIFGQNQKGNSLYIVTANHVVRQGPEEATDVQVQFFWEPEGNAHAASLQKTAYADLDLAVLKVENVDQSDMPSGGLPYDLVGDAGSLKPGDKVHLVGNPNGHAWDMTRTADAVTGKTGSVISFEVPHLQPGHSGGALLDEHYRVVGVLTTSQGSNGKAVNIESVIENLSESRYPIGLKPGEVQAQAPQPQPSAPVQSREPVQSKEMDALSTYAARGEILAQDTSLATAIRGRIPEGPMRRGFDIGMGVCEGHTAWGPGKQAILDTLSNPEQRGFLVAKDYSLDRNNNVDFAKRGAAIAEKDAVVKDARASEPAGLYWLGFDIATGIFGDPALGAQGNTATGPGSLGIRDKLSADAQRGFNDSVKLHLSRNYRR
jgi:hypothetical protein